MFFKKIVPVADRRDACSSKARKLFQEKMQKLFVELTFVRLIAHRQVEPRFFVDDGFVVRERIKAGFAVVSAHAAFADAAEAHFARREMNDDVVDATAAVTQLRQHAIDTLLVV